MTSSVFLVAAIMAFVFTYTIQTVTRKIPTAGSGGNNGAPAGGGGGGGGGGGRSATSPGGWLSPLSNLGATEMFMSAFLFLCVLWIPIGQWFPTDSWEGFLVRLAIYGVVAAVLQKFMADWWSIEGWELFLGVLIPVLILALVKNDAPIVTIVFKWIATVLTGGGATGG